MLNTINGRHNLISKSLSKFKLAFSIPTDFSTVNMSALFIQYLQFLVFWSVLISFVLLIKSYKTTILILYIVVSGNPTLLVSLFYKLPVSHVVFFSFLRTDICIVIVDTNEAVVAIVLSVVFSCQHCPRQLLDLKHYREQLE